MGSYCELYIDNHPVLSSKSYAIDVVMTLFREEDKKVYDRKISERNSLIWGHQEDDGEVETVYEYSNTVEIIIDRLEVMSFTISRVEHEFKQEINELIQSMKEGPIEGLEDLYKKDINILENTSIKSFIETFKEIRAKKLQPSLYSHKEFDGVSPLANYILNETIHFHYGFPCQSYRSFIRAYLESCPKESLVTYDITDLVSGGYYEPDDAVCEMEVNGLIEGFEINTKAIILTEGSSDGEILRRSLKILYPHLYGYYSFMDFGVSNAAGGADALVSQVKSFVGSGIANRIVALFDNDTAAFAAVRGLNKTEITQNIVIEHYPKLELAEDYPTLGPTGISNMDVNGLACSIEIYLGKEVLNINGQFTPVQWKGFDSSQRKYQGELIEKRKIQQKFFEKLSVCEKSPEKIESYDWSGLRSIFNVIFNSFKDKS